ncbi:MAG: hypothetical protein ACRD1G_02735, partial [Acidimicrobiales bacterium]
MSHGRGDNRSVGGGGGSVSDLLSPPSSGTNPPTTSASEEVVHGPGRADQTNLPRLFLVLVCVITVGGLLLRLPSFNDSLAGDEISTYFIVVGNSLGRVMRLVHSNQETTPPLYFIVAWATKGFLGS